jgi:peptidoglycan hydrolase-like protein with peptidoglycan-binding domain
VARWGEFSGVPAGVRRRGRALTAASAATVLIAGIAVIAFAAPGSHASPLSAAAAVQEARTGHKTHAQDTPTGPLQVVSMSPARGSRDANGGGQIKVTFSAQLSATSPMPVLSPHIAGTWQATGDTATFTPAAGFQPGTKVTVTIPGGSGGTLASAVTESYVTGKYSVLGLQALLGQLGYLPLTWTPAVTGTSADSTAYDPQGTFSWQPGYPGTLHSFWRQGKGNLIDTGAIRAFEADHGLTMDGEAGPAVWRAVLKAARADQVNKHGYTYALASKSSPETLTIWHDGRVVLRSLANTGISLVPTSNGTYPVYLRYYYQIMKGKNPDGSKYADPVYYVAYFNGGDAVHFFPRASYGFPQSLGCVELPWKSAAKAWPYLTFGSLVTVNG